MVTVYPLHEKDLTALKNVVDTAQHFAVCISDDGRVELFAEYIHFEVIKGKVTQSLKTLSIKIK